MAIAVHGVIVGHGHSGAVIVVSDEIITRDDETALAKAAAESGMSVVDL
jgi:hypothetical protein